MAANDELQQDSKVDVLSLFCGILTHRLMSLYRGLTRYGFSPKTTAVLPPIHSYSTLTDADHDGGVYLERLVLVCVALFTEVGPEVALADLRKVLARESLK